MWKQFGFWICFGFWLSVWVTKGHQVEVSLLCNTFVLAIDFCTSETNYESLRLISYFFIPVLHVPNPTMELDMGKNHQKKLISQQKALLSWELPTRSWFHHITAQTHEYHWSKQCWRACRPTAMHYIAMTKWRANCWLDWNSRDLTFVLVARVEHWNSEACAEDKYRVWILLIFLCWVFWYFFIDSFDIHWLILLIFLCWFFWDFFVDYFDISLLIWQDTESPLLPRIK